MEKQQQKQKIRIISSNIRFDNPKDNHNAWNYRKDLLSKILNFHAGDFLGTQEGRYPQLQELQNMLSPHYSLCDQHRHWIEERMYPCIFFHQKVIERIDSGDIWLSETPEVAGSFSFQSTFPRLATWMKARHKFSGQYFLFANLHLDHVLSETRAHQIQVFAGEIQKINRENFPLIISGDFNEGPSGHVRKNLFHLLPQLFDPWQIQGKGERSSHHHFAEGRPVGERIDWILCDSQLKALDIFFDETSENGLYPSDHYPLITDLQF